MESQKKLAVDFEDLRDKQLQLEKDQFTLETAQAKVSSVNQDAAEASADASKVRTELRTREDELSEARRELADLRTQLHDQAEQLRRGGSDQEALRQELALQRERVTAMSEQTTVVKSDANQRANTAEETNAFYKKQIEDLRSQEKVLQETLLEERKERALWKDSSVAQESRLRDQLEEAFSLQRIALSTEVERLNARLNHATNNEEDAVKKARIHATELETVTEESTS